MDTAGKKRRRARQPAPLSLPGTDRGRGRLKRAWIAPEGNIALSIILHPKVTDLPYLIMIASLAAVYSIETVTGRETQVKWPNDILVNGKKVCGILIENEIKGNKAAFSIVGIGITLT